MPDYLAPLKQMKFTLTHLADFSEVSALPDFSSVDADTVEAVLEEAAKFAGGVLAPTNVIGDRQGVKVVGDGVEVPAEFTDAYARFCEGGWPGIASNPESGGQGLPKTLSVACDEMWAAANVAFALCPELSQDHRRHHVGAGRLEAIAAMAYCPIAVFGPTRTAGVGWEFLEATGRIA